MKKTPFFSIVIPTYNRAKFLEVAIAITLQQAFKDFELIVSNNCSTDNTREVVKSFKDKRIRYFENKKNIGGEPNMRKVMSYARGIYIFTLGDDDFILFENTLGEIKKLIDKKQYGFIRLNLIERKFIGEGLRKSIVTEEKNIEIKENSSPEKIINFFNQIAAGHFAGLVIKNYDNLVNDFYTLPQTAWIKIIYNNTKKFGAYFVGNLYMIITWSQGEILSQYIPKNNRLMFEEYTDFVFSVIPKERLNSYKLKFYNVFVILQPVIKLYSNNDNLKRFNKRLLILEPRLKKNFLFWISFGIAYIIPGFIWKVVRVIQHSNKNTLDSLKNKNRIYNKFNKYSNIYLPI